MIVKLASKRGRLGTLISLASSFNLTITSVHLSNSQWANPSLTSGFDGRHTRDEARLLSGIVLGSVHEKRLEAIPALFLIRLDAGEVLGGASMMLFWLSKLIFPGFGFSRDITNITVTSSQR